MATDPIQDCLRRILANFGYFVGNFSATATTVLAIDDEKSEDHIELNDETKADSKTVKKNETKTVVTMADEKKVDEFVLNNDVKAFNSQLGLQDAFDSIFSVAETESSTPGCIKPDELKRVLNHAAEKGYQLRAYDGFEPSGRMHIAQGLMRTINVNKMTRAGIKFVFYVADWFAQLNNKYGGDLEKIREVGTYFVKVWTACGMDMNNVEIVWASEEINNRSHEYWPIVMDLARTNSVARIRRCGQIMGRKDAADSRKSNRDALLRKIRENRDADANLSEAEFLDKYSVTNTESEKNAGDDLPVAQLLYPLMQCTDIFFLNARICQLGMDQLKVNMLAREYSDSIQTRFKKDRAKRDLFKKPIIISHHMLMGLKAGQEKMSKSDPNSAIFMEDNGPLIRKKIKQAFCAEGDIKTNPILDYLKHIIFPKLKAEADPIERTALLEQLNAVSLAKFTALAKEIELLQTPQKDLATFLPELLKTKSQFSPLFSDESKSDESIVSELLSTKRDEVVRMLIGDEARGNVAALLAAKLLQDDDSTKLLSPEEAKECDDVKDAAVKSASSKERLVNILSEELLVSENVDLSKVSLDDVADEDLLEILALKLLVTPRDLLAKSLSDVDMKAVDDALVAMANNGFVKLFTSELVGHKKFDLAGTESAQQEAFAHKLLQTKDAKEWTQYKADLREAFEESMTKVAENEDALVKLLSTELASVDVAKLSAIVFANEENARVLALKLLAKKESGDAYDEARRALESKKHEGLQKLLAAELIKSEKIDLSSVLTKLLTKEEVELFAKQLDHFEEASKPMKKKELKDYENRRKRRLGELQLELNVLVFALRKFIAVSPNDARYFRSDGRKPRIEIGKIVAKRFSADEQDSSVDIKAIVEHFLKKKEKKKGKGGGAKVSEERLLELRKIEWFKERIVEEFPATKSSAGSSDHSKLNAKRPFTIILKKFSLHDEASRTFDTYDELEAAFAKNDIHPSDLKPAVADYLVDFIEPVRMHFEVGEGKALLDRIAKFKQTK